MKTQTQSAKSEPPVEKARRSAPPEPKVAPNPVWGNLALRVQTKLTVNAPRDAAEVEADRVAASVMRMPAPGVQRKCAACAAGGTTCPDCEEEAHVQRKADTAGGHGGEVGSDFASRLGGGAPLDAASRAFFEPRFGRDLGDVRVHAGTEADSAARSIQARAFTLGRDIAFASGEFDAHSDNGRSLLAHELVHVVQQSAAPKRIQRSLSVNPTPPIDAQDPLSKMGAAAFAPFAFSEMRAILGDLCPDFTVDAIGNVVPTKATLCESPSAVAGGSRPVGCCCLCAMTASGSGAWTISLTGLGGPTTRPRAGGGGEFILHPRNTAFQFGAFDVAGNRGLDNAVVVAGHEICGHGALLERGIHPDETLERVDTDVHDPTVKMENLIRKEQGLPGADRALATGPHRGESFGRITVRNFPLNGASAASLPAAERDKIQLAKDFINAGNLWVDIFGHSDLAGSPGSKLAVSQSRADSMKRALTTGTRPVSASIAKTFTETGPTGTGTVTVKGNRFTKIEGRSDFDAIPGASAADLRRVDIDMPTRPAGTAVPPAGTPAAVNPVGPKTPRTFILRRFFGNGCDRLLARSAWT